MEPHGAGPENHGSNTPNGPPGMPAKRSARTAPTTLREWRRHRGLTLERVANKLGVETSTVHKWEAGKTPVDLQILSKLARVYETEPAALLFPPASAEVVEQLRIAYRIIRTSSPEMARQWLNIGEAMADRTAAVAPSPLPSLTGKAEVN